MGIAISKLSDPCGDSISRKTITISTIVELVVRKPTFGVSEQVPHKPGCTATEDGKRLEFSVKVVMGLTLYYPYSENKGAEHLCGYRTTDLRLCFRMCKKLVFS